MMQVLRQGLIRNWIAVLLCLVLGGGLFGLGYWQGQRSLRQQMKTLTAQATRSPYSPGGSTSTWAKPNGAYPMSPGQNAIPPNATPEMKEFLENRATLTQKMAELRQQNPNGAPDPKMFVQFREQNKELLDRQQQLAQVIAQQQAKNPLPEPPPLHIPPNASPQMQAYLTAKDQLMRDQIAFMNQHRTDDPAARQAAMQQWRQQNATRYQQVQQLSQALTPPAPTQAPPATPTTAPTTTSTK